MFDELPKKNVKTSPRIQRSSSLSSSEVPRICLIINPAAGRGGNRSRFSAIEAALRDRAGVTDIYYTAAAGDEEQFAQRAISSGFTTIVAAGGDGTCGRIADRIVRAQSSCALTVIPSGTGNDFAKTIGLADKPLDWIADLILQGATSRIDVGRADGHHFLNSCGFGFDASVLEASNKVRFLKGDAVYIYSALRQLFGYRGIEISSTAIAGAPDGRMLMVTVSNGRSLGGAFQIAPHASVTDGELDVCFIADASPINRMRLFAAALRGKHIGMRGVVATTAGRFDLVFDACPTMEVDGELRTARDRRVELTCVPRALSVIGAPGALS